jgi:PAS domain-containing protein
MTKKTVCYIGSSETTCNFIARQISRFLGEYIEVKIWCLQHDNILPHPTCDIYIAASNTILSKVGNKLPPNKPVLLAARTINIENLENLFELTPGTRAIVVAISQETALSTISILENFGMNYLDLVPYYPDCGINIPKDIEIAITPGVSYLVPYNIKKIVDVGVRGIDLSTFAELIRNLDLSMEVINEISHHYIEAILNLSIKQYKMAASNEQLKRKMEVIINTVGEAIVAVDENNKIIVFNPVAERLLEINRIQAIGKDAKELISRVDQILLSPTIYRKSPQVFL